MRLLFVKLKHIGDSLILTPTLEAVRQAYPSAEIWVVVRGGCEGILAGCTAIDHILTSVPPSANKYSPVNWFSDLRSIRLLRKQHFDYAFELGDGDRGRGVVWLSRAKIRATNTVGWPLHWWWQRQFNAFSNFNWQSRHRVEKDFYTVNDILPLPVPVPPLVFAKSRTESWAPANGLKDFSVFHPGTRWMRKRWPVERWIELGRGLLSQGHRIILSAGPDAEERSMAGNIQQALGPGVLSTDGQVSWAQLAGLLYRARLFVGVDTAAMHLAAACQCPVVGLFGPSSTTEWRPWQVEHRLICPSPEALSTVAGDKIIQTLDVKSVQSACQELLALPSNPVGRDKI